MASELRTADPSVQIPKRHLPWFTQMLMAFAVLVLAAIVYGFVRMAAAPMPKLDVPAQEAQPRSDTAAPATAPAPEKR